MKREDMKAKFVWEDPLLLEQQLSEDERMVRDAARAYCQDKLMPRVIEANRHEKFDREIMNEMSAIGLFSSSPRVASMVTTRFGTPTWIAARPTPGASYIVSNMSATSFFTSPSIAATGSETSRRRLSGSWRIGRMDMGAR